MTLNFTVRGQCCLYSMHYMMSPNPLELFRMLYCKTEEYYATLKCSLHEEYSQG